MALGVKGSQLKALGPENAWPMVIDCCGGLGGFVWRVG